MRMMWSPWPINVALLYAGGIIATNPSCASSESNLPPAPAFISITRPKKSISSSKCWPKYRNSLPRETLMVTHDTITPNSTMRDVLEAYPGAQRTLFRRYHIGGCSSCAFQPDETLEQVCGRNGHLPVDEVLAAIRSSHEGDARIWIEPKQLVEWREQDPAVR